MPPGAVVSFVFVFLFVCFLPCDCTPGYFSSPYSRMGPKKALTGQAKEVTEGATAGREGSEMEIGNLSQDVSLQELKDLFQTHITMQQAQDSRMEQEAVRQEARWKALHHQFSLLQQEVHVRTTPVPNPGLGTSTHDDSASHPSIQQTSQEFMQSSSSRQPAASPIPHQNRTKEDIGEVIVLEQFLRMLDPDLQIWIKERDPKTASEAAALADVFLSARRKNTVWTYNQWRGFKESKSQVKMPQSGTKSTSEGTDQPSDKEVQTGS